MNKQQQQQPVQVIQTRFKTDKGDFIVYHLVESTWIRNILGGIDIKSIAGRATVKHTKAAFMKAINTKAGSRIVFKSKEALLKDVDKRLHNKLKSELPMGDKLLKNK